MPREKGTAPLRAESPHAGTPQLRPRPGGAAATQDHLPQAHIGLRREETRSERPTVSPEPHGLQMGLLKPRSPHLRAAGERERQAARTSPPGKGARHGPLGAPLTLLCGVSSTPNGPPEPGPLHPPSEGQLSAWQGAAAIAGGWADRGMLRSHQQLTPDGEEDRCHPPPPQPRGSVQPHLPQSPFLPASHPPPLPRPDPEGRKEGKTQRGPRLSPKLPWGETRGVSDSRACSKAKLKPHKPHVQDSRIWGQQGARGNVISARSGEEEGGVGSEVPAREGGGEAEAGMGGRVGSGGVHGRAGWGSSELRGWQTTRQPLIL